MLAFLFPTNINADLKTVMPLFTLGFFICAVVCHGELHRLRPQPRYLTSFYFMVALGGALGGLFVGLLAPMWFRTYLELPIGLLVTVVFIGSVLNHAPPSLPGPTARYIEYALIGGLGGGLVFLLAIEQPRWEAGYQLLARNFYGAIRVEDYEETEETSAYRELHHGTINHGSEFMRDDLRRRPTTYYARGSGVGIALSSTDPMRRVGVIGLGAGTLAAYCRPGDVFRFYEINPVVVEIAKSQFFYMNECNGHIDVVLGDARLSLEREEPQEFDVLAVDAFSGDSIPVHLLTLEAFREYFRHVKPDGIIAVHVSNKYLDLGPVVARAAKELKKAAVAITNPEDDASGVYASDWILLSSDHRTFAGSEWHGAQSEPLPEPHSHVWTDDYSNLLRILK
jgi:spermidine synthase